MLECLPSTIVDCKKINLNEVDFTNCEDLTIWHYNPASRSLNDLPYAKYIKSLKIYHSNITSFEGLERFGCLKNLETAYCRNLMSFDGIPMNVSFLMIEHAPKLFDYDKLARLKNVEVLRLHECGNMANLSFISSMDMLREFRFFNTSVLDGNLQPLIEHYPKLQAIAFNNKRHYSHTLKQIHELLSISS